MHTVSAGSRKTYDMAYIALFTVLIVICSWISIPTAVPFTMQTFGVFMAIAAIIWFDPDSLVKILMEERAQAVANKANATDGAVLTDDTTQPTDVADPSDVQVVAETTTIQTETPDENDTTN